MANIQTDVDRMISFLKENGEADIDTLSRQLALPRNIMEGWLKVLEEENLVRLEYRLTKLHVIWIGQPLMPEATQEEFSVIEADNPAERFVELEIAKETEGVAGTKHGEPKRLVSSSELVKPKSAMHTAGAHSARIEPAGSIAPYCPPLRSIRVSPDIMERVPHDMRIVGGTNARALRQLPDGSGRSMMSPSPFEGVPGGIANEPSSGSHGHNKHYATRISAAVIAGTDGTVGKVEIGRVSVPKPVQKIAQTPQSQHPVQKTKAAEPRPPADIAKFQKKAVAKIEMPVAKIPDAEETKPQLAPIEPARKPASEAYVGLSEKYKSYLELVNRQADELAKLREEKDGIYREGFLPLEKRFESELDVMTTKLFENEKKVLELYNRALGIPDRVVKLDGNMLTLREMESESERHLKETKESVLARIRKKKGIVDEELARLDALEREMQAGLGKVHGLEKVNASLQNIEHGIEQQIRQTSEMLADGRARVGELTAALERLRELKTKAAGDTTRIKSATAEGMEELQRIRGELKRFNQAEKGVALRLEEHEKVIREFKEFVKDSDTQYSDLRGLVESQFVDTYTKELNGLLRSYEFEVNSLSERDQKLDARIAESKRRLIKLISDAKGIISEAGKDVKPVDRKKLDQLLDQDETIKNLKSKRE